MKRLLLVFSFFAFTFSISFGQSWRWGRQGINGGWGTGLTTDNKGYTYFVGMSGDSTIFGNYVIRDTTSNEETAFIVKYDTTGNVIWAISFRATQLLPIGITTDVACNLILTGQFSGTLFAGKDTLMTPIYETYFILKIDSTGNIKWAVKGISINDYASGIDVKTDVIGNIYLAGQFGTKLLIGQDTLYSGGSTAFFAAKFDPNGNAIWAKQSGETGYIVSPLAETIFDSKYLYFSCRISYRTKFGTISLIDSSQYDNVCLLKMDTGGNFLWAKAITCNNQALSFKGSVQVDKSGYIYIDGNFGDTLNFSGQNLFSPNLSNGFLIKYSPSGNVLWGKQASSTIPWNSYSTTIDGNDNIYISSSGSKIQFGAVTLNTVPDPMDNPVGVIKFDTSGTALGGVIIKAGGGNSSYLSADNSGKYIYLAGTLADSITIGSNKIGPPGNGQQWAFIASWDASTVTGIEDISHIENSVLVYPNPSQGIFNFQVQGTNQKANIEVYNMLGEKVHDSQYPISSNQYSLDLSSQPPGIYLYRIISEKGEAIASGKLVIEK
jgi:hypothetical protein